MSNANYPWVKNSAETVSGKIGYLEITSPNGTYINGATGTVLIESTAHKTTITHDGITSENKLAPGQKVNLNSQQIIMIDNNSNTFNIYSDSNETWRLHTSGNSNIDIRAGVNGQINLAGNGIYFNGNNIENGGLQGATGATGPQGLPGLQGITSDILNKLKLATSQISFIINGTGYVGSGWFYYENTNDLVNGYFITAAHCVMEITNGVYYKADVVYIHHPITNDWTKIDANNIYIDGVADVALIKTNINLTNNPECCLKISSIETNAGDTCYIIGNPGGFDEDSISVGCVRDPHYMESGGYQITDSIHITSPGIGGNSGGPIVNTLGDVIGIFTFGLGNYENFGGGSNRVTLLNTLSVLKTLQNNKSKLYLGLDWYLPNPLILRNYYNNQNSFISKGVYIRGISVNSPFNGVIGTSDILLSATITTTNEVIDFGNLNTQRTPGVLIYYPVNTIISITYVKTDKIQRTNNITLNKSYNEVSNLLDGPLQTGLNERVGLNINRNQIQDYT